MTATLIRTRILVSDTDMDNFYASVLDAARFPSIMERGLAIVGDDHVSYYPDSDVLSGRGFCIASMAIALRNGRITAEELGDLVDDVRFGEKSLTEVNQMLYAMRPLTQRRELDITADELQRLGLDADAVFACLGAGVPRKLVFDLVGKVSRGSLSADHANTGFGCMAEEPRHFVHA